MRAIFDTKADSAYDDDITERYHFPSRYLSVAQAAKGDWIVYREPIRNGGRRGYVAVARVVDIEPDPARAGHWYARMDGFLPFDDVVPLTTATGYYEGALRLVGKPSLIGAALQGKSVRPLTEAEFGAITMAGFGRTLAPDNARRLELDAAHADPVTLNLVNAPLEEQERQIEQILVNRKIRDASFRRQVLDAYDDTCAVTGIKIVNGGGKAEAQAAHIWPVASGGPDIVRNGIALSATAHWLFDRHLISLTDDYGLLVAHNRIPAGLQGLFVRQMKRVILPEAEQNYPGLQYIRKHRDAYVGR